jgi:O-antigen/teichoic acid export membrane protein
LGLKGAALAFCLQNTCQFVGNWILLHRSQPGIHWARPRIDIPLLKESIRYGLSVQGLVLAYALLENGSKLLMVRSGHLSAASYFDMAFRIGKGLRVLLSSALRVLVPRIVSQMHIEGQQQSIYTQSFLLVTAIAVPMYMTLLATADVLSWVLIGQVEPQFMWAVALALCPWMAYCFIDPALNTAMAQGQMRWAVLGHGLKVLVALALLCLPLFHDSATGMYAAVAGAMVAGSAMMLWMAHRQQSMPLKALTPGATSLLLGSPLCVGLWGVMDRSTWLTAEPGWHSTVRVVSLVLMPLAVLWWHPGGQRLMGMVRRLWTRPTPEAQA